MQEDGVLKYPLDYTERVDNITITLITLAMRCADTNIIYHVPEQDFHDLVVPILTSDDPVCGPALTKHLAQVTRNFLRLLERRKMSALVVLRFKHDLAEQVRPPRDMSTTHQQTRDGRGADVRSGELRELTGEVRHADGDGHPLCALRVVVRVPAGHLVVDVARGGGPGTREPVDGDPLDHCGGVSITSVGERARGGVSAPSSSVQGYSSDQSTSFS